MTTTKKNAFGAMALVIASGLAGACIAAGVGFHGSQNEAKATIEAAQIEAAAIVEAARIEARATVEAAARAIPSGPVCPCIVVLVEKDASPDELELDVDELDPDAL